MAFAYVFAPSWGRTILPRWEWISSYLVSGLVLRCRWRRQCGTTVGGAFNGMEGHEVGLGWGSEWDHWGPSPGCFEPQWQNWALSFAQVIRVPGAFVENRFGLVDGVPDSSRSATYCRVLGTMMCESELSVWDLWIFERSVWFRYLWITYPGELIFIF